MTIAELKDFLDEKVIQYNNPRFLEDDPLQIPHRFSKKEDIEISGFLTATIAWGNRKSIINNALRMMELLDNAPYDFVLNHTETDLEKLFPFVHRTLNGGDFQYFIKSIQSIYMNHNGLESIFLKYQQENTLQPAISKFKEVFFELPHQTRTMKHVSDPLKGS
ncbi:MAG: DUF2400 family protein, partial [Flavobacteriaceae bacterium]